MLFIFNGICIEEQIYYNLLYFWTDDFGARFLLLNIKQGCCQIQVRSIFDYLLHSILEPIRYLINFVSKDIVRFVIACEVSSPVRIIDLNQLFWVNLINLLRAHFTRADPKSALKTYGLAVFLRFWDLRLQKMFVERWWNWPLVSSSSRYQVYVKNNCTYIQTLLLCHNAT